MNAVHCILFTLNYFLFTSFRFQMRANLQGVGADLALRRRKGSWRTDSRKTWFVSTRQMDIIYKNAILF